MLITAQAELTAPKKAFTFPTLPPVSSMPARQRKRPFRSTCRAYSSMMVSTAACQCYFEHAVTCHLLLILLSINSIVGEEAPTANFSTQFQSVLGFSDSQIASFQKSSKSCGYETLLSEIKYPPKGKIPLPNGNKDTVSDACDLFDKFYDEGKFHHETVRAETLMKLCWEFTATDINPCFNICMSAS